MTRVERKDMLENHREEYLQDMSDRKKVYGKNYRNSITSRLEKIKSRCNNNNTTGYKYYGGKGIKCTLDTYDLKMLWDRDQADKMTKPSISRKNHDKDYTVDNCCYMEFSEHISKDKTRR